jgi:vesicle-fusing ATPase
METLFLFWTLLFTTWLKIHAFSGLTFPLRTRSQLSLPLCSATRDKVDFPASRRKKQVPSNATASYDTRRRRTDESPFEVLAGNVAHCLIESDRKRAKGLDGSSTGWTSWIDEPSASNLQKCIDTLRLKTFDEIHSNKIGITTPDASLEDEFVQWIRWMKSAPSPVLLELSTQFRSAVHQTLADETLLCSADTNVDGFLKRIACRLIVLPSGSTLSCALQTAPGAMVYGKLLFGGVKRYRLIGASMSNRLKRRVGERTLLAPVSAVQAAPSWLQYGGPERNYEAVDIGPSLIMEVTLLPTGLSVPHISTNPADTDERDLTVTKLPWNVNNVFSFGILDEGAKGILNKGTNLSTDITDTRDAESAFGTSVGGLRPQIDEIVRRVLEGRLVRSANENCNDEEVASTSFSALAASRQKEMQSLLELGLQPVRGLLLYGPPGCGKTQLAREISTLLDARPSKIVAAPELLDRWVGGSERLIRELFVDAEVELKACNGDPTRSGLHVVVIDECDAVFRRRASSNTDGTSEMTRASAVNQILSKLDGVHELGNVLLIGMTNRKEMLDPALLRPGRLEVHVEIPLPDREGRREILKIHFGALRRRGRLSKPLCEAIDGVNYASGTRRRWNQWRTRWLPRSTQSIRSGFRRHRIIHDLAADSWTDGFSGADLSGLVRCAASLALERCRLQNDCGVDSLFVTIEDVYQALVEVQT